MVPTPSLTGAFPEPLFTGLEEISPASPADLAAAFAFGLSRLASPGDRRPLALAGSRDWLRERGRPFPSGRVLLVVADKEDQALWALEEALKSGAVSGGLAGAERVSLLATRRLGFAAREGKAGALLLRPRPMEDLSAAQRRWRVASRPSGRDLFDARAPGAWRLRAELLRRRDGPPGAWELEMDDETHRLRLVAGLADHGLVADARTVAAA